MTEEELKEAQRNWRLRWLSSLFEFSHIEYQIGLWIEARFPNEIGCFVEDICQYFDDLYLNDDYENQLEEKIITLEEYDSIKEFHFALGSYLLNEKKKGIEPTDKERLSNTEWKLIVELGLVSWNKLKKVISNEEELEHMTGLERNYL